MTPAELDAIEARLTASGGPWRIDPRYADLVEMTGGLYTIMSNGKIGVPVSVNPHCEPERVEARVDFLAHAHDDMTMLIAELRVRLAREERDRAIDESHRRICAWLDNGSFSEARAATNDLARIVGEEHRDVVGLRTMLHFMTDDPIDKEEAR